MEDNRNLNYIPQAHIKIHDNVNSNNIVNNYFYSNLDQNFIPQSLIDIYNNTSDHNRINNHFFKDSETATIFPEQKLKSKELKELHKTFSYLILFIKVIFFILLVIMLIVWLTYKQ